MHNILNFNQAKEVLYNYIPKEPNVTRYNLDNMKKLMKLLGNPQNNLKVIHIAGTSGKTSTSYYIASLLKQAGYKTGLTVSPHIDEINERVQIDLIPLAEQEYCQELSKFINLTEKLDVRPSYFELLIAFAYFVFNKKQVDYAVVEVGLGGLLDGTNVIDRIDKICVITDIGLDHTKILGSTIKDIALQKAGTIKHGNEVFIHNQQPDVMNVIKAECSKKDARLNVVSGFKILVLAQDLAYFQKRNIQLAIEAVNFAINRDFNKFLTNQNIYDGSLTYIPARMEIVKYMGKTIIIDGSHNEQKIGALVEAIKRRFTDKQITSLVSFGQNKQSSVLESLRLLRSVSREIILTNFDIGQDQLRKSIDSTELSNYARKIGFDSVSNQPNSQLAFDLLTKSQNDVCLFTGSFYLLNEIRPAILRK